MMHAGIFGPTLCGKTTLAQSIARNFETKGTRALVLDPYNADWGVTWQTRSIADFIEKAKASRSCALFVDEAGQLDLRDPAHEWLLTGSRHWGHVCHVMGQSGIQLTPLGRSSITRLFLFRSTRQTASYWSEAFVDERINQATNLQRFEFIRAEIFGDVERCILSQKALDKLRVA